MDARTTVLMTADTVGGVWSYAMNLCASLIPHGVQVHLLTLGQVPNPQQRRQALELRNVTLHESGFKLEWMENPWKDVFLAREWIHSVYESVRPDLIHFNNYVYPHPAWKCPVITVFHSCVLSWWRSVKRENAPADWSCYHNLVQAAFDGSNAVVFPSKAMFEQAMPIYGRIPHPKLIYNGISAAYRQADKQPFIMSAGRLWDEAKNGRLLCEIADDLKWQIVLAGAGLESQGHSAPPKNVRCLGHISSGEMNDFLARASIFAMPAKYEPFGLAVLEAAASQCALALGDIPTLRELWGDAALYFDPFSRNAAADVLATLINDKPLRDTMGAKASEKSRKYSSGIMAEKYASLYRSLLKRKTVQLNDHPI